MLLAISRNLAEAPGSDKVKVFSTLDGSIRSPIWDLNASQKSPEIKNDIRLFRQELRDAAYHFQGDADNDQLSVTPLDVYKRQVRPLP